MIIGLLKTVMFGGSFRIEVWIEIHVCCRLVLVVLKLPGEDLEWGGNHVQN